MSCIRKLAFFAVACAAKDLIKRRRQGEVVGSRVVALYGTAVDVDVLVILRNMDRVGVDVRGGLREDGGDGDSDEEGGEAGRAMMSDAISSTLPPGGQREVDENQRRTGPPSPSQLRG